MIFCITSGDGRGTIRPATSREWDRATSALPAQPITTVDDNNFRRVLPLLTNNGMLRNENATRLAIQCSICHQILSPINLHFGESPDTTYEHYTVLKRRGHAFGYRCITHVSNSLRDAFSA